MASASRIQPSTEEWPWEPLAGMVLVFSRDGCRNADQNGSHMVLVKAAKEEG